MIDISLALNMTQLNKLAIFQNIQLESGEEIQHWRAMALLLL